MHSIRDWKRLLLAGAFLLPASAALAQDATPGAPAWPQALRNKNARYANLTRTLDEAGDRREQVMSDLILVRSLDPLGDLEEKRRYLASKKVPPRATRDAVIIPRELNLLDDNGQVFVATLPTKARRHAELRRFRDLAGDTQELARYRDDRIRFGLLRGEVISVADKDKDRASDDYFIKREDDTRRETADIEKNPGDQDRLEDRTRDRREERELAEPDGRRDFSDRTEDRENDRAEAEGDRDADRAADKADKDAEKDADKDADKADRDVERDLEKDVDKTDRDTERQIENEAQNGAGTDD